MYKHSPRRDIYWQKKKSSGRKRAEVSSKSQGLGNGAIAYIFFYALFLGKVSESVRCHRCWKDNKKAVHHISS